jgi:hypothetical protein
MNFINAATWYSQSASISSPRRTTANLAQADNPEQPIIRGRLQSYITIRLRNKLPKTLKLLVF